MARSRSRGPGSVSPWWGLALAFPLALLGGVLVGRAPVPAARPAPVTIAAPDPDAAPALPAAVVAEVPATVASAVDRPDLAASSPPPAISPWSSYDEAIAESERTGKPVLLDFNAEWCPPCRMMKQELFEDPSLDAALRGEVIPVAITDRRREDGRNPDDVAALQERFGVHAFPTLIVLSARTGKRETSLGYGGPVRTLEWIAGAARGVR